MWERESEQGRVERNNARFEFHHTCNVLLVNLLFYGHRSTCTCFLTTRNKQGTSKLRVTVSVSNRYPKFRRVSNNLRAPISESSSVLLASVS